jgi:hypothetical protein
LAIILRLVDAVLVERQITTALVSEHRDWVARGDGIQGLVGAVQEATRLPADVRAAGAIA